MLTYPNDSARYIRTLLQMNLTKIASEGENLKSKSGQIHGIEHQSSNGKVIKFAGVPVLSVRVSKKGDGTQRLGSKVNFFSTRSDTFFLTFSPSEFIFR